MRCFPWELVGATAGVAVPIVAALREFVLAGRERLGYRVQMDTTAQEHDYLRCDDKKWSCVRDAADVAKSPAP